MRNSRVNVEEVLNKIGEKPSVRDYCPLGAPKENVSRPVKFTLSSSDHATQVIRNASKLYTKEGYRSVYICLDRTAAERRAYKNWLKLSFLLI